jgi:hypothetical protein
MNTRTITFALLLAALFLAPTSALMAQVSVEIDVASAISAECNDCNHAYNERFCSFCSSTLYLDQNGLCEHGFCVDHHQVQRTAYYPARFGLSWGFGWRWNHHHHNHHHCGHHGGHHGGWWGINPGNNGYSFYSNSRHNNDNKTQYNRRKSPRGNDIIRNNPKKSFPKKSNYARVKNIRQRVNPTTKKNNLRKRTTPRKSYTPSVKRTTPRKSYTPSVKRTTPRKSYTPSVKRATPRKSYTPSVKRATPRKSYTPSVKRATPRKNYGSSSRSSRSSRSRR